VSLAGLPGRWAQTAQIGWHYAQARWRWARLSQDRLAAYHDRRMGQIVAYANLRSPFYRQHWRGHDLADWRSLPPVDKQLMMANFTRFNTRGIEREQALAVALAAEQQRDFAATVADLTVGLSSGTSGHRGLFLVSPAEQAAWAGTILARTLRLRWQPTRVAFFLRSNSNLYEQVGGRLVQFRYFDLMLPLEQAIGQLNGFQPDILVGPPSLLELLARELGASLRIRPERLIAVAEVLEPQDGQRLRERFGVPVDQIYQCTEGLIAVSCAHGALHIQEDVVAIQCEPLPGDPGRVQPIVSDLWRTTQPIVRYRLNDVLTLSQDVCPCGSDFRVIASIEGRCDDIFTFPTSSGAARPVFPDLIRRMVLLASAAIADYQATQERCGQLEIRLALGDGAEWAEVAAALDRTVRTTLAAYDCHATSISIAQGLPPLPAGAKRRRVWRRPAAGHREPSA
jgi:phenylacetate-CoA ligase